MSNFFGQLVESYGENIIQGQKQNMDAANLELKQQEAAMNKMNMMQAQQKQQTQQGVAKYISAAQAADKGAVDDPTRTAKMYEHAAAMEIAGGNFQQAEELSNLSKGKLKEAAEAKKEVLTRIADAKETLAKSAQDYTANPTPEGSKVLAQNALKAGVPPASIPIPGSPAWATWVTQQQTASMSVKEQRDFTEKQSEFREKQDEAKQVHKDNEADKLAQRQQTAAIQAGVREDRAEARQEARESRAATLQEARENRQERRENVLSDRAERREYEATKQSPAEKQSTNAIVASASEAVKGFKQIMDMPAGQQTGFFTGLHDGTMLKSLEKNAGAALTQRDAQLYNVATSGLSLEIGRVLTLGGGRGVNKAQLDEFKEMATTRPGEDPYVAMYKLSNAADTIRNRMSTLPDSANPKILAQQKEVEKFLASVPTTAQVQASADRAGRSTGGRANKEKMNSVMAKVGTAFGRDEEQKGVSSAVQSALDKYK